MRKFLPVLTVALLCLLAVGCDDKIKTSDQDIKQVTYPHLKEMLADKVHPTVLLDPRIPKHYDEGHIAGAINLPLAKIIAGEPELANALNIVVYGTNWTDYMSPAAAKKLMALGYANVFDFRGGVEFWRSEGGQVIGTAATQPSATAPK